MNRKFFADVSIVFGVLLALFFIVGCGEGRVRKTKKRTVVDDPYVVLNPNAPAPPDVPGENNGVDIMDPPDGGTENPEDPGEELPPEDPVNGCQPPCPNDRSCHWRGQSEVWVCEYNEHDVRVCKKIKVCKEKKED